MPRAKRKTRGSSVKNEESSSTQSSVKRKPGRPPKKRIVIEDESDSQVTPPPKRSKNIVKETPIVDLNFDTDNEIVDNQRKNEEKQGDLSDINEDLFENAENMLTLNSSTGIDMDNQPGPSTSRFHSIMESETSDISIILEENESDGKELEVLPKKHVRKAPVEETLMETISESVEINVKEENENYSMEYTQELNYMEVTTDLTTTHKEVDLKKNIVIIAFIFFACLICILFWAKELLFSIMLYRFLWLNPKE